MPHEEEFTPPSAAEMHRQENEKYRLQLEYVKDYMEKIRNKPGSSSPRTSTLTSASSDVESRTSKPSLLSTPDAGNLGNGGQRAQLTTSSSGSIRHGRISSQSSNTRRLADLANRNTISKDNTTGDEVREAEILNNMGKKIGNTRQQAKELGPGDGKWRNRGRRM